MEDFQCGDFDYEAMYSGPIGLAETRGNGYIVSEMLPKKILTLTSQKLNSELWHKC